jgi:hypothetical protein
MNNKAFWCINALPITILFSIVFLVTYFSLSAAGFLVGSEPNIAVGDVSRWCERVNQNILREPINALSNIGFMIAAIFMIRYITQDYKKNNVPNKYHGFSALVLLYIGGTYFLGPGSMFMHGTHTEWGQWIDNLSMVMYIIIPWLINLKEMAGWSTRTLFLIYLSIAFIYAVTSWIFDSEMGINLDLWALSIGLWIISETLFRFWSAQFRVISGFIGFLVAAVFGISPIEMITNIHNYWWIILFWIPAILAKQPPKNQRTYNPWFFGGMAFFVIAFYIWGQGKPGSSWCNPDSLLQFHGIWHLMCAVATWCFFKFLRTEVAK